MGGNKVTTITRELFNRVNDWNDMGKCGKADE